MMTFDDMVAKEQERIWKKHLKKKPLRSEDIIDTDWEIKKLSAEDVIIISAKIKEFAKRKTEVNWINYLFNTLLWTQVKKNVRWDKKTLYWILANFDELAVFMPTPFWVTVVELIDKMGESLYKDLKARGKTK